MKINEEAPIIKKTCLLLDDVDYGIVFSGDKSANSILPQGTRMVKLIHHSNFGQDEDYIYYADIECGTIFRAIKGGERHYVTLYEAEVTLKEIR